MQNGALSRRYLVHFSFALILLLGLFAVSSWLNVVIDPIERRADHARDQVVGIHCWMCWGYGCWRMESDCVLLKWICVALWLLDWWWWQKKFEAFLPGCIYTPINECGSVKHRHLGQTGADQMIGKQKTTHSDLWGNDVKAGLLCRAVHIGQVAEVSWLLSLKKERWYCQQP